MTTYRTRPLFDRPIDWARLPQSRIEYDLREVSAGFGAEAFYGEAEHIVHGWTFTVWGDTEAGIGEIEDFFHDLQGRRGGFWLPTPVTAFRIAAIVSGTVIDAHEARLAEHFDLHPLSTHVWFTKDGETPIAARILSIEELIGDTERITLDETVAVDTSWQVWMLAYVRLADDKLDFEFVTEGRSRLPVRVIELPAEYAAAETGQRPIWLYHFWTEDGAEEQHWRYTSFAWPLTEMETAEELEHEYHPARISHGSTTSTTRNDREELIIESDRIAPLTLLCPTSLSQVLHVEVIATDFTDITDGQRVVFVGRVMDARAFGRRIVVRCASYLDAESQCPAFLFQARCNYRVYEPGTCRVDPAGFEQAVGITGATGRSVSVAGAGLSGLGYGWFAGGWIEFGSGADRVVRSIVVSTAASGTSLTLLLNAPLPALTWPVSASIWPGCDGTQAHCTDKFSNFVNFGGHRFALRNLAIKAIEVQVVAGGKK